MVITTIYYIFNNRTIPFTYFFQRYNAIIFIGTVVIAFVIFAITMFHGTEIMNNIQRRMWVLLLMLFAMIYVLPMFIEDQKSSAFEIVSIIICYTFALQGLIHLTAFLYEPLGDYLFEMKPEGLKEKVYTANVARFRLYCLSGIVFVELAAAYGVAFMLFFRLLLNNSIHPYFNSWVKYVVLFLIFTGTALSGRTGFVGLGLGVLLWVIFSYDRIFIFLKHNFFNILLVSSMVVLAYNFLLTPNQRKMFNDELFPFAFEWYYSYRDYGTFNVGSLEGTETHYYRLYDETLLKGHGVVPDLHTTYENSDAGYINNLVFGGIPYLILLIIYQGLYFFLPISIARKEKVFSNRVDATLFILFFLYIFLLNYKTTAIGTIHIVETLLIAAGSSYVTRYYSQQEEQN